MAPTLYAGPTSPIYEERLAYDPTDEDLSFLQWCHVAAWPFQTCFPLSPGNVGLIRAE